MHVEAHTTLTADEAQARLASVDRADRDGAGRERRLVYESARTPPKFYLPGVPITPAPAAEVAVDSYSQGTAVVLRMMWGPLPAPFLRVLALAGLLVAAFIVLAAERTVLHWLVALVFGLLPLAALAYQRAGERQLQARLGEALGGVGFSPMPY